MEHSLNKRETAKELDISRSNLYYKPKQPTRDWNTKVLIEKVLREHPSYGHKRLAIHLGLNKKRILRVMKLFGIKPYRRRGRKPPNKATGMLDYPNLLLNLIPLYPNHIWASDFTYLWFGNAWLYVATVIDLHTRRIVGLFIGRSHDRWLVTSALLSALGHYSRPEIIHSDHGREYCSRDYQNLLKEVGILPSMAAKGCPWENGYQESFYSQWKIDLGDQSRFKTLGELTAEIYKTIYQYNNTRIHTVLKMAPSAFARQYATLQENVESVS